MFTWRRRRRCRHRCVNADVDVEADDNGVAAIASRRITGSQNRTQETIPGRSTSKYFEIFRNISNYFEKLRNILKYFQRFRDISEYFDVERPGIVS